MSNIRILKTKDGYCYQYLVKDNKNKRYYVTKNGFNTQKEAQEAGEYSYKKYIEEENYIKHNPIKVKNLNLRSKLTELLITTTTAGLVLVTLQSGNKILDDLKEKFKNVEPPFSITQFIRETNKIEVEDCDFSNLHIVIRSGSEETIDTAYVISNQLSRMDVSNEIITYENDLEYRINNSINNNLDKNVILIDLEYHIEYSDIHDTVIRGDSSNQREYPSDVLLTCLNTSYKEYGFTPAIRSGEPTGEGWRRPTTIDNVLTEANLINRITKVSISLSDTITEDEIIRNDAASSVVEGLMRFASLSQEDRYKDILYVVKYGDTISDVSNSYNINYIFVQDNSDIDIHKQLKVGDFLLVGEMPEAATEYTLVDNPNVTSDINEISVIENCYIVQEGDTLINIAHMYGVEVEDIITTSGDPNNIQIGETLFIETNSRYETHKKIDLLNQNDQSLQI